MIDVAINVYGKPWQTLCTLKSLKAHSGQYIDKIYMTIEKEQPYDSDVRWIVNKFKDIEFYIPEYYHFQIHDGIFKSERGRFGVRYQFGIERSNKKHIFITHNDVLYRGDLVGALLDSIDNSTGVGHIGQCWNCPASTKDKCNSEKFGTWLPSYDEVIELGLPHIRTTVDSIDIEHPFPLPECRLNEWACLIDREICMEECRPNGTSPLFGVNAGFDTACGWFRSLYLKGYRFKHYPVDELITHGFWASAAGYPTQLDKDKYAAAESSAREYYERHYE